MRIGPTQSRRCSRAMRISAPRSMTRIQSRHCAGRISFRCRVNRISVRHRLSALCILMAIGVPLGAQEEQKEPPTEFLNFESVVEYAVSANSAVSMLQDSLAEQLTETGLMRYLQGIGISVSGVVSGNPSVPISGSGNAALSADIELLPQLSINGSLSVPYSEAEIQQLEGSIGLYITPLADATARPRDLLEIQRTKVYLESAVQTASYTAISQLLNAVMAERQVGLNEMEYAVAEQALQTTRSLYEKDQTTEQAFIAAKSAFRSQGYDLSLSSLAAEKALQSLAHVIGMSVDQFRVPAIENLGLSAFADQAAAFLDSPDIDLLAEISTDVRLTFLDVQEAEIDLSGARGFSPTLSVTANTTLPGLDYSVGAQFAFSISDFDLKARSDARKNLTNAGMAYENTLSMALFDVRQAVLELKISLEELEAAREALASDQLDLAETHYFAEQGEATALELAQSELAVLTAENAVLGAEVEVASRWLAIEFAQF